MKKAMTVFLSVMLICMLCFQALSEDFLPSLDKEFGIEVPFAGNCIGKEPSSRAKNNDGTTVEIYTDISYDDYQKIGQSYGKSGFSVAEQDFKDDLLTLKAVKQDETVAVLFNVVKKTFTVIYPRYFSEDYESYQVSANDSCLFPDIEDITGPILPRLSSVLLRAPDSRDTTNAGKRTEEYRSFTEDDYKTVSSYLQSSGCSVKNYTKEANVLVIELEKHGILFVMKYDPDKHTATVVYDTESYIEPVVTSTPVPTATPVPTVDPSQYNSYAAVFVAVVKGTLKSPESLQVNWINVMEYNGDSYIVIDFSGMNSFGGYNRNTYSFKFEYGRISFTGNSSDYDQYENHRSEFSLVASLDVDDVMRIVNK